MTQEHTGDDGSKETGDPLLFNKIAAAALSALLLVFGLPQLAAAIFSDGHHGKPGEELHLAYCCVELETAAAEAGGAGEADLGTMMADASMSAGERSAALCSSCHSFEEGGANGTGPNLWDIVGRDIAGLDGFRYSSALQGLEGDWTYERLDAYIENSQEYVPGTAMVQRIGRADKRADILAYLGSLSDDPVPFPEPAAAPEESADAGGETAEEG